MTSLIYPKRLSVGFLFAITILLLIFLLLASLFIDDANNRIRGA
jgi:hypothetical protein